MHEIEPKCNKIVQNENGKRAIVFSERQGKRHADSKYRQDFKTAQNLEKL
jgi:hypothetical protein